MVFNPVFLFGTWNFGLWFSIMLFERGRKKCMTTANCLRSSSFKQQGKYRMSADLSFNCGTRAFECILSLGDTCFATCSTHSLLYFLCFALNGKSCFYHVCQCVVSCLCTSASWLHSLKWLSNCDSLLPCFCSGNLNPWIGLHVLTLHTMRLEQWSSTPHNRMPNISLLRFPSSALFQFYEWFWSWCPLWAT